MRKTHSEQSLFAQFNFVKSINAQRESLVSQFNDDSREYARAIVQSADADILHKVHMVMQPSDAMRALTMRNTAF